MKPSPTAVNRLTLREQVLEALRTAIISGELRPGTSLVETELAETYAVSRGTVREALRTLQQADLVEGDARGKLRVHRPAAREIREMFHVRAALETMAAGEIIASPDREQIIAELRAALPPASEPDFGKALNSDLAFHELLCLRSGNSILHSVWKGLEDRMRTILFSGDVDHALPIMSGDRHAPIVDAISSGDATQTQAVIWSHMDQAADYWAVEADPD